MTRAGTFSRTVCNLDAEHAAIREEGVLFRQAFSVGPIVLGQPRPALLTGQMPAQSGMIGLAHRGFELNDYRQHIVRTLSTAGYESALVGVQHEASSAQESWIGYDAILAAKGDRGTFHHRPAAVNFWPASPTGRSSSPWASSRPIACSMSQARSRT